MLTSEDMELTFAQYVVKHGLADIELDENGYAVYEPENRRKYKQIYDKLFEKWLSERGEWYQWDKQEQINADLAKLKAKGFECELRNFQNGHIQAKSRKLKKTFSYYSGTGTIVGYGNTGLRGIDHFIELLQRY